MTLYYKRTYDNGYFQVEPKQEDLFPPFSAKWLKLYYPLSKIKKQFIVDLL